MELEDVVNIQVIEELVEAAGLGALGVVHQVTQETQDNLCVHEVALLKLGNHLNDALGLVQGQLIFVSVVQSKRISPDEEHLPHV